MQWEMARNPGQVDTPGMEDGSEVTTKKWREGERGREREGEEKGAGGGSDRAEEGEREIERERGSEGEGRMERV
eukprot:1296317-Rhodomonas_salina.1